MLPQLDIITLRSSAPWTLISRRSSDFTSRTFSGRAIGVASITTPSSDGDNAIVDESQPNESMWTMLFDYRWPTHGYEATREAAMAAFAKSWRRE